jgi:3-keto-5-aminohexanoate cleavage enzyme
MFQDELIINVCLSGIIPTRQSTPHVPIKPEEIASDVVQCVELGASMFHIHARNGQEGWDWRKETYQAIMDAIRSVSPDAIICFTTTGRRTNDLSKRTACLDTDPPPHMASLSMGSFNFRDDATVNDAKTIAYLLSAMKERGIKPEIEIFDLGMARTTERMMEQGLLEGPVYANLILGNDSTAGDSLIDLATLYQHLPDGLIWCAGGIGRTQQRSNMLGILYGRGVRVGIEDNPYCYNGAGNKTPAPNSFFVRRIREIGQLLGKNPLSIDESRKILGLIR